MPKRTRPAVGAVYDAADQYIAASFRSDGSLFTPEVPIWTLELVDELHESFILHPDTGPRSFMEKLHDQLSDRSPAIVQAMAELMYFHLLATVATLAPRKREILDQILSWSSEAVEIPPALVAQLGHGLVNPGTGFNSRRDWQISFLIDALRDWKLMASRERDEALQDPWAFKEYLYAVKDWSAYTQRNAVLHFVFPDTFESIVSRDDKKAIVQRFKDLIPAPSEDVDRELLEVRRGLAPEYGDDFDFYDPPVVGLWRTKAAWDRFIKLAAKAAHAPDFDLNERDYKLKAAARLLEARQAVLDDDPDWPVQLKRGFQNSFNNLTPWQDHSSFVAWAAEHPEAARPALLTVWSSEAPDAGQIEAFVELLPKEVVSSPGARTAIGSFLLMACEPQSFPIYRPKPFADGYQLTGTDAPHKSGSEVERYEEAIAFLDEIIEEAAERDLVLRDRLDAQSVLWVVTKTEPEDTDPVTAEVPEVGPVSDPVPTSLEQLATNLCLPLPFLSEISMLLERKRQIVFHGPPGTGKTFVARKLAEYLAGADGEVQIVQFHPSYAYEDFVEGFRPRKDGTGFTLREGPLKRLANRAKEHPDGKHILIIDELNRGNVAKVFGELYFLLEYRSERLTLQYSDEPFRLPKNLFIIATMNEADRSIALLDGALRRRFFFVPFDPAEDAVGQVLATWLDRNRPEMAWVADLVAQANAELGDRHAAIGPSHFMVEDLDLAWLELIWKHSVMPYLAEQFFGDDERLARFELANLRKLMAGAPADMGDGGQASESKEAPGAPPSA